MRASPSTIGTVERWKRFVDDLTASRLRSNWPQRACCLLNTGTDWSRLSNRFRLLTGGRQRVQRQQTLLGTLDWSHDLLDEIERTLLRRLAVFNGSFTVSAIEGVCTDEAVCVGDVIDVLGSLVAKSLVVALPDGRYRLLETVRLYAEEQLVAAGEAQHVRNRHRDWFLEWVESFPATGSLFSFETGDRMELEHDNIAAATNWSLAEERPELAGRLAAATNPMWRFHVHHDEAAQWLRAVLAHAQTLEPDLHVICGTWATQATIALMTEDTVELARATTSVEHASATGPLACTWGALVTMAGTLAEVQGDPRHPTLERAVHQALTIHKVDDAWRFMALSGCANGLMTVGRYAEAVSIAEQCLAFDEIPDDVILGDSGGSAHGVLIVGWHLLGDDAEASRRLSVVSASGTGHGGRATKESR